jgi:hypothetical protein
MRAAHAGLAQLRGFDDRFTIAIVRHLLDWWRSFWAHRMRLGWQPEHEIDSRAARMTRGARRAGDERLPGHFGDAWRATLAHRRSRSSSSGGSGRWSTKWCELCRRPVSRSTSRRCAPTRRATSATTRVRTALPACARRPAGRDGVSDDLPVLRRGPPPDQAHRPPRLKDGAGSSRDWCGREATSLARRATHPR